ncbi:ATP-dependent RNA helicase dbp10, partial [Spiromyces aspiralis]
MPLEYNSDSDSDASLDLTSTLIPTKSPSNVTATRLKDTTAAAVPLLGKQPRAGSNNTNSIGDMSAILDELVKAAADPRGRTSQDSESDSENEERNLIQRELIAQNRKMKKSGGFQSMGLSPFLFKAIIHKGFKVPTPIQRKTIPHIMEGQDVVGMARTGSGKTAAFVIPLIERLKAHSAKVGIRAVIMSPSRELVLQTLKVCKELGKYTDLRAVAVVGGDNMEEQFSMMASNPDIVVATPGRFLHLVVEMKLELKRVEYVVFDEADRLFEMGFSVQLHELLHRLPPSRQTLLFSATLPSTSVDFAKAGLNDPQLIRLDVDSKISKDLEMAFFNVKRDNKDAALLYLLREVIKIPISSTNQPAAAGTKGIKGAKKGKHPKREQQQGVEAARDDCDKQAPRPPNGQTIVFVATKHHVEYISHLLQEYGFLISYVYGSLDQTARQIQISRFRSGQTHIMVVTDVAARGIDIPILENVINYDFVDSSKVFVHRVGRVARAGRRGWAYSIVSPDELPYLIDLQLFLGRPLRLGSQEYKQQGAEPDYTNEVVLGQMPSSLLELNNEWVIRQLSESVTLQG